MLKKLLYSFLGLFLGTALFAAEADSYRMLLFGDMHFDRSDCRTAEALKSGSHAQEMQGNLISWAEDGASRKMLAKAAAVAVKERIPMAIQIGDFTQGDAGSAKMAAKMQAAWLETVHSYLKMPVVPVMGNHDLRGKDAEAQARKFLTATWNAELKLNPPLAENPYSAFAWHCGPDVFIFFDNVKLNRLDKTAPADAPLTQRYPAYGTFVKLLEENPAQRYTFVVCHLPILPVSAGSPRWIPFGNKKEDAPRRDLLKRLCARQAIVLCGHIHLNTFVEYTCPEGRVSQLTVISLFRKRAKHYYQSKLTHGTFAAFAASQKVKEQLEKDAGLKAFLEEYGKGIRGRDTLGGAGFNVLRVTPAGVFNDFHDPEPDSKPQTLCLRKAERSAPAPGEKKYLNP